ncbi:MAG: VOC family protein [Candidatus Kariarchaeaceae archaeon]|jgi:predicted enzyme related to lactoylglutathione lyase
MTINKLILVTVLVRNQEKSLEFYTKNLGFEKRQDLVDKSTGFRWLSVAPVNQKELAILIRKPHANDHELLTSEFDSTIGKGTLWSFSTSDCQKTYDELKNNGVKFLSPPTRKDHGIEAIFEDLDGNRFNLLEVK